MSPRGLIVPTLMSTRRGDIDRPPFNSIFGIIMNKKCSFSPLSDRSNRFVLRIYKIVPGFDVIVCIAEDKNPSLAKIPRQEGRHAVHKYD